MIYDGTKGFMYDYGNCHTGPTGLGTNVLLSHMSSFQAFAIFLFDHLRAAVKPWTVSFLLLLSVTSSDSAILVLASWFVIIWGFIQDIIHTAWLALLDVCRFCSTIWMSMSCRKEDYGHHLSSIFLLRVLLPRSTFMDLAMLCLFVDGASG